MEPNPVEPRRLVFLFSDTGGGHRSAAEAIIEALQLEFPTQIRCEMIDFFKDYSPRPFNQASRIYTVLSRMPHLWKVGYRLSDGARRMRFLNYAAWPYVKPSLSRLIPDHPCDLVVSVHGWVNMAMSKLALNHGLPYVTVVTDLISTHSAWYARRATQVIVPTEAAYQRGLKAGLRPAQLKVVGMPVAERFCAVGERRDVTRARLGWISDRPVILLVGGGEGMGPLEAMAAAIDEAQLPVSLAVICGRNQALRERLVQRSWSIPAHVYGFVTEMPAFMRAADILVSKAGPGTICEAFIAGLPMILYGKMPGQEDGNVTFVMETGAGVWAPQPEQMLAAVRAWLQDPACREQAAATCRRLARPDASRQIARLLARQVGLD
jgi:1,2-diacylglycerol 3-beta-galactosyltransferase